MESLAVESQTMSEQLPPAPQTGNHRVDVALAEFGDIHHHDAADHHARLSHVQEVLASVLENPNPMPRPQLQQ